MGWFNFTTGVHAKVPDYGLSFEGIVTTATDTTHFKVSTLAGKGAGFFIPASGDPFEIYVVQADAGAPEGEHKPVVAYTTADGTFQHAVFSAQLAVGDIVLLIHPWLARLLDLYTDWKDGGRLDLLIDAIIADITSAVDQPPTAKSLQDILHKDTNYTYSKTDDSLEAIRDRIDTLNTADQGDLDQLLIYCDILDHATNGLANIYANIASILVDYLNHGTWGLAAIRTGVADVKTDTYNIHNNVLSAINDYLGHGTWGLSVIRAALQLVQTDADQIDANVLSIINDHLSQMKSSLCRWGQISAVSGDTFTSAHLAGLGVDAMPGWWVYVMQADDAAPEGEYRLMTDYTDAGVVTHNAFSTALAIGDRVQLMHPALVAAQNLRGGVEGIQDIIDNQNAELDTARGKYTKTMTGGEDDLYGESSDTEFRLEEFTADLHNMAEGDTIIFRVYKTEDGVERQISNDLANTFTGPQTAPKPPRVEIIGSSNMVWGREDISVTTEQTDGTVREIVCYWRDSKRSG